MTDKIEQVPSHNRNGGFVYPINAGDQIGESAGITRRDECADKIAAGIWASDKRVNSLLEALNGDTALLVQRISKMAYAQADAMIAEGRKGEE